MKLLRLPLLATLLAAVALGTTARAQDDGREVLRQAVEAARRAPAYRVTVTEAGSPTPELRMEVVNPDLLHLRSGMGTEVYSDGKTVLSREGTSGPFTPARGNVAAELALARQMATPDAFLQMATGVRLAGHDNVNGSPASIYAVDALVLGMRANARVWIADADRRPLRVEGEVNGEAKLGSRAGGRPIHRKATVVYDYDPSIRIVLPTN